MEFMTGQDNVGIHSQKKNNPHFDYLGLAQWFGFFTGVKYINYKSFDFTDSFYYPFNN